MPRHKYSKKYNRSVEPFYGSLLIEKAIYQIMKKGKKNLACSIINETLQQIERKTQKEPIQVIEQAIQNVTPSIEIKARRIGGAVYSVPKELGFERGTSIGIRWILNCCRSKSGKTFSTNLANEFIDASNKTGLAVRKRDEVYKMAESTTRLV